MSERSYTTENDSIDPNYIVLKNIACEGQYYSTICFRSLLCVSFYGCRRPLVFKVFFFPPRSPARSDRERVRFNSVERKTHSSGKLSTSNRALRTSGVHTTTPVYCVICSRINRARPGPV